MWSALEKPRPGVILPGAYPQNLLETPIQVFAGGIDRFVRADQTQPATRRTGDIDKTGRVFRIVMVLGAAMTVVLLLTAFRRQIFGILKRLRKGPLAQTPPTRTATPPRATPPHADRTATPPWAETPTPTESVRSRARLGTMTVDKTREEAWEWLPAEKMLRLRPYLDRSEGLFTPDQVEQLKAMRILELRFMNQPPVAIQIDAAALETFHHTLIDLIPSLKWSPDINVHRTACQILKWVGDNIRFFR